MKTLLFDFSRTMLFPTDESYTGGLNSLHDQLSKDLGYDFFQHFKFNEELLKFLEDKQSQFDLYIFTTGDIQNTQAVQKRIKPLFNQIYSAKDLEMKKDNPDAYKLICKKINRGPKDVTYIDDSLQNLRVAQEAGLKTIHFNNTRLLIERLSKLI